MENAVYTRYIFVGYLNAYLKIKDAIGWQIVKMEQTRWDVRAGIICLHLVLVPFAMAEQIVPIYPMKQTVINITFKNHKQTIAIFRCYL